MGLKRFISKLFPQKSSQWVEDGSYKEFEAFSVATVTKSFKATVSDEISVRKGSVVRALYKEDDWLYVENEKGKKGFVPQQYCSLFNTYGTQPRVTAKQTLSQRKEGIRGHALLACRILLGKIRDIIKQWEKTNMERFLESLPIQKQDGIPYNNDPQGKTTVTQFYQATRHDDISVLQNQVVTVLNDEDCDWLFVRDSSGKEGFIPLICTKWDRVRQIIDLQPQELLVVDDFVSRNSLDMSLKQGEWVTAVYNENSPWIWCKRRKDGSDGFAPTKCLLLATDL